MRWPGLLLFAAFAGCGSHAEPPEGLPPLEPPPDFATVDAGPGAGADMTPGADLPTAGTGMLRVRVTDHDSGRKLPSRVIITAVEPTRPVAFDVDDKGHSVNGEQGVHPMPGVLGAPEGVMLETGEGAVHLPPGTYDVMVNHGPEWEDLERRITITPTEDVLVEADLDRTVDTTGWLAADLHIHTGRSFDSHLLPQDRVTSEVAVGVELLVSTDHNVMTDLHAGPGGVMDHGYEDIARGIIGNEFNFDPGHGGAYPMPYDDSGKDVLGGPDGGATRWKLDWDRVRFMLIGQMFQYLATLPTAPAVTINHPRMGGSLGFFENLVSPRYGPDYGAGWHPPMPLAEAGSFDALELMSGYMQNPDEMRTILRDWFFLLSMGHRIAALGSSDTHRLRDVKAGFPRTWLRMPSDDPSKIADADLAEAIRKNRTVASNGPFVWLTVDGAEVGDVVKPAGRTVKVEVTVDAPAWIAVDTLRIFVNGQVAKELPVGGAQSRPRLVASIAALPIPAGDAWVVAQVSGKVPLPTALIGEHEGGTVLPFAITSPVYLDTDGDSHFDPRLSPQDADPGPLGPLALVHPTIHTDDVAAHTITDECEPPLWTIPSQWVNP